MKNLFLSAILICTSNSGLASHFHIALPVTSETGIKEFYGDILGAYIEAKKVADTVTFAINLDGNSLVMRVYPEFTYQRRWTENVELGGQKYDNVDAFHFGAVVSKERWIQIREEVLSKQNQHDLIEIPPYIKNEGRSNEVGFMILKAPSGYSFEVKFTTNIHTGVQDAPKQELRK